MASTAGSSPPRQTYCTSNDRPAAGARGSFVPAHPAGIAVKLHAPPTWQFYLVLATTPTENKKQAARTCVNQDSEKATK
jgi:hypothetical protein